MFDWDYIHPYKGYLLKVNNEYFITLRWIWKDPIKMQYPICQKAEFGDINDSFVFRELYSPNQYIIKFPECKNAKIVDFKKEIRKLKLQKINK